MTALPSEKNLLFSRRTRGIGVVCITIALLLIGKLYLVQIVHGKEFSQKAARQYARPEEDLYDRGSIFFEARDKTLVSAAGLKSGYIIALNPRDITDPEGVFRELEGRLSLERDSFIAKASKRADPYEEVARRVSEDVALSIAEKKIPGVLVFKERWRFYPGGALASHALGFVGWSEDEYAGRYGLERYYEDVLRRDGETLYSNFFAEIFGSIKRVVGEQKSLGDVITSIEPNTELFLEETLNDIEETYDARQAGGIIMDPKTGRIYAMALSPDFDPNEFGKVENQRLFGNTLVEGVYEMGSIMKPLTVAAGLDAGVITATSTYYDEGSLTLNNKTISNFDGKGRGRVSMQEVLNQSLNTGAAYVALKLGGERFRAYMQNLELGEETGIDLPGEAAGLVQNLKSGRDIEIVTASYGQGVAFTPIQTIRALAALGNGGYLVTPHLATRINYKVGISRSIENVEKRQVLSQRTSEEITRMLVEVVDRALLEGRFKQPNHSIAAKTGTALIARSDEGGYYSDRFLHSFFGYFPAYNPRFIIFLFLIEPKGVAFASHTLTEPFIQLTKFLINYYEIPPDR